MLKAGEQVFPGTVKHGEIPQELRQYFQYPEDLFKVQRDLLAQYHVEGARQFFSTQTFWDVPPDPTGEDEAGASAHAAALCAGSGRPVRISRRSSSRAR